VTGAEPTSRPGAGTFAPRVPGSLAGATASRRSGPSAALVLGTFAGVFAAATFLPAAVPLVWQVLRAEEAFGLERSAAAAYTIHRELDEGTEATEALATSHGVASVRVRDAEGVHSFGLSLPQSAVDTVCASTPPRGVVSRSARDYWAVSCVRRGDFEVAVGSPLDSGAPTRRIVTSVLMLALFVGIVTALGILRILRPLSVVSVALERVRAGERGVNVPETGLWELDQLVRGLNSAARAVDDREDGILGRIEVVQEMSRIVAHEIRNPLQSIELLSSLVAMEDDPKERLEIAQSIHQEVHTLGQVVHRLLRESAATGGLRLQFSMASVAPLVDQVVALRRPQANAQGVRITIGAMSWTEVELDAALIKRSIENLVLNALQAVALNTGEVRIQVQDDLDHLLLVVEDNGPGIPDHLVDHVFEPNVTHGKKQGLGLGLTLVKGVIEAHGGYIRYDRSPLGGARFTARIPIRQQRSEEQR
jgi:signal transduction histidine kinase